MRGPRRCSSSSTSATSARDARGSSRAASSSASPSPVPSCGFAALVFVFLYAPIVVVIVYAFNGGRETLVWDGFSTRWFGAALRDTAVTDALRNSLVIAAGMPGRSRPSGR